MKTYKVKLQSTTPLLYGRQYQIPKNSGESSADFEKRTWMNRAHVNTNGNAILPPLAIKNCLRDSAKYRSEKIDGAGKSTFTKHFKSGIMVFNEMVLLNEKNKPIVAANIEPLWLNVPSDGMTGGTKRVPKAFPQVEQWAGEVEVVVLDDKITKEVLERHLATAGDFIGLGAMRVGNGGVTGRFRVAQITEVRA